MDEFMVAMKKEAEGHRWLDVRQALADQNFAPQNDCGTLEDVLQQAYEQERDEDLDGSSQEMGR